MSTVRETVIADARRGARELTARRLFITFSAHARKSYIYAATKIAGNEGNTLLDRPEEEIVTVDCASLADAFIELLNDNFEDENAERVKVSHGHGFATPAGSRCFDTEVVGNIRKAGETWAMTKRCVFNDHYFVASGNQTRMYFDPCMFTTYSRKEEAISWRFETGLLNMVKRIEGNPSILLVRLPTTYAGAMPKGFNSGFIAFRTSDLKKDEYGALWGRGNIPKGWNDTKYQSKKGAAVSRVNKLLLGAGVIGKWTL